jgi:CRISPR/Cas system-associated protein Cas7 (RAMP superfamily)
MVIIVLFLSLIIHIITDQSDESSTQQIVATRKQQINRVKNISEDSKLYLHAKALSTQQDEETRKKVSTREKKNEIKRERPQEQVIRQKER